MIQLLGKLDRYKKYWVGVSGGIDSMVALHFLKQMRFDVKAFHVNHHTEACKQGHAFLMEALRGDFYTDCIYPLVKPKAQSWEEYWRKGRYDLFNSHLSKGREVITAHHLGDVIETWVHGSLHGQPKLIPYRHGSVIRPFLTTPKEELVRWAKNPMSLTLMISPMMIPRNRGITLGMR